VSRLIVWHVLRMADDVDDLRLRVSAGFRPASPTTWHSVVHRHARCRSAQL